MTPDQLAEFEKRAAEGEPLKMKWLPLRGKDHVTIAINGNSGACMIQFSVHRQITLNYETPDKFVVADREPRFSSMLAAQLFAESLLADATRALHPMAGKISEDQFNNIVAAGVCATEAEDNPYFAKGFHVQPKEVLENIRRELVNSEHCIPAGPSDAELIAFGLANEEARTFPFITHQIFQDEHLFSFHANAALGPWVLNCNPTLDDEARAILRAAFEKKEGEKAHD